MGSYLTGATSSLPWGHRHHHDHHPHNWPLWDRRYIVNPSTSHHASDGALSPPKRDGRGACWSTGTRRPTLIRKSRRRPGACARGSSAKKNGGFTKEDPNGMFVQGGRMGGEEGRGSKNHVRYENKIRLRVRFSISREFDK